MTTGYQFPAGPGNDTSNLFYANVHFDRRLFGWLYPLVEFNCIYHTTSVNFGLPASSLAQPEPPSSQPPCES